MTLLMATVLTLIEKHINFCGWIFWRAAGLICLEYFEYK